SWVYAQKQDTGAAPVQEPGPPAVDTAVPETELPRLPTPPARVSPETLRLLEMIERKNRELKKREEDLLLKEKNLKVLEQKILSDLKKIEDALARTEEMLGIKKDLIEKNVQSLVRA
ncbi:MAG: hypothetical protein GWM98_11215, partial [Nitrospinaceae bacterium]|nr:hypothetical protein [Nitrospinaceae bacterium]NIR54966.1 hypothetical protein [Nitrospinaceae bacterium]NIS85379.1 hypothetical protein [Nitrospinaceae bacterium]NIT82206.1 hypothetical protein [Nitrospinaceae bacterium]NIU44450.1 hypothetical protein [Nitrospinaceae bacterium]